MEEVNLYKLQVADRFGFKTEGRFKQMKVLNIEFNTPEGYPVIIAQDLESGVTTRIGYDRSKVDATPVRVMKI